MQQIPQGGSKVERPSMSEIERIQRYIERTRIPEKTANYYELTTCEYSAFLEIARDRTKKDALCDALVLAYYFGRAKGYRAAKKLPRPPAGAIEGAGLK